MGSGADRDNEKQIEEMGDTVPDTGPRGDGPGGSGLPPRYRDAGLLGRGGMGEVRLCTDTAIGREVAVKLSRFTEPIDRARFVREALVQGRLEHPAIVPVYDVGALETDQPFFTMKRVSGVELTCAELSRHRLLGAFVLVCQAVDYAHGHGVLHRDLKPANIMLGDLGEVYVLDWGLAKVSGELDPVDAPVLAGELDSAESRADVILGTPGYIAPERLFAEPSDHRADVFALGCILYEILAGEPLHRGPSVDAILRECATGEAARERIDALEPEVGPELAAICRRATAADPAARTASAGELWREVEGYLEGDRDQARRRELAAESTDRARWLVDRAIAGRDDAARAEALAALGRALALDPESAEARAALVRLLVEPPAEVPAEVEVGVEASSTETTALLSRLAAGSFAVTAVMVVAVVAALGVTRWDWVVATFAALALLVALCFVGGWIAQSFWLYVATIGAIGFLLVATSRLASPLLVAPVIAPGYAMLLSLHYRDVARWLAVGVALLGVGGPLLLELAGVLSPTFELAGDALIILPQSVNLPPIATPIVVLVIYLGAFVAPAMIAARLKTELHAAERRVRLQAWQLERLVP
jgi:serine/threonine-protein kinase